MIKFLTVDADFLIQFQSMAGGQIGIATEIVPALAEVELRC